MIVFDFATVDLSALDEESRRAALLMYRSGLIRRDRSIRHQMHGLEGERRGLIEQVRAIERLAGVSRPYDPEGAED